MQAIDAVAFELWSITNGVIFDNVLVTSNVDIANMVADTTYQLKRDINDEMIDNWFTNFIKSTNKRPWLWGVYVIFIVLPVILVVSLCFSSFTNDKNDSYSAKKKEYFKQDEIFNEIDDESQFCEDLNSFEVEETEMRSSFRKNYDTEEDKLRGRIENDVEDKIEITNAFEKDEEFDFEEQFEDEFGHRLINELENIIKDEYESNLEDEEYEDSEEEEKEREEEDDDDVIEDVVERVMEARAQTAIEEVIIDEDEEEEDIIMKEKEVEEKFDRSRPRFRKSRARKRWVMKKYNEGHKKNQF